MYWWSCWNLEIKNFKYVQVEVSHEQRVRSVIFKLFPKQNSMSEKKKQDLKRSEGKNEPRIFTQFALFKYKNTGPLKHARIHETNMKKKDYLIPKWRVDSKDRNRKVMVKEQ